MIDECGSEAIRLFSLKSYEVLDTPNEAEFDEIVGEAVALMDAPIALISLVDEHRQWFKARVGLSLDETPREFSFCDHTIRAGEMLVVEDATKDARFAANPLVLGDPCIRFYAGAPLTSVDGTRLGSLCVIDRHPRAGLTPDQSRQLAALAERTMAALEARRCRLAGTMRAAA